MGARPGGVHGAGWRVVTLATVALLLLAVTGLARAGAAGAQAKSVNLGEILVADPDAGQVVAIGSTPNPRIIQNGLMRPVAVTALADGTVLVAESTTNRILGFGGRYADGVTLVENLADPQGLTTGSDGTPYVSLGKSGEVGRIDLAARAYVKIADGLRGPAGLAERGGFLYVAESTGNAVTQVSVTGEKTPVGPTLQQPVGVAVGPGRTLFVSEAKAGRVSRLDENGAREDFASVDTPQQLAVDPFQPGPDSPFTLTVAAKGSVQRFDQDRKRIMFSVDPKGGRGVAGVPPPEKPGAGGAAPASTRARAASSPPAIDAAFEGGTPSSTSVMLIVLAVLMGLLVSAGFIVFIRESKGGAQAGFEDRPLDESVFEVFGPCAAQEVELAEAEGALRAIVTQRRGAEQQELAASRRASGARDRLGRAQHARQKAARARQNRARAGQREPLPGLRSEELRLRTGGGRAALVAFRSGEIDARVLEDRWQDLGESYALERVQVLGMVVAAKGSLSMDEALALRAEQQAKTELDAAEQDRHHAAREIERLREREQQMMPRIREAREAIEGCHQQHGGRARAGQRAGRRPDGDTGPSAAPARPAAKPVPVGSRGGVDPGARRGATGGAGGTGAMPIVGGTGRGATGGAGDDRSGAAPGDRTGLAAAGGRRPERGASPGSRPGPAPDAAGSPGSSGSPDWLWSAPTPRPSPVRPPGPRGPLAPGTPGAGTGRPPSPGRPPAGPGAGGPSVPGAAGRPRPATPPAGPPRNPPREAPGTGSARTFAGEGWPWGDAPGAPPGPGPGPGASGPAAPSGSGPRKPGGPGGGPRPDTGAGWPPASGPGSRAKGTGDRQGVRPVSGARPDGSGLNDGGDPGAEGPGTGRAGAPAKGDGAGRRWPGYLDSRPWPTNGGGPPSLNRTRIGEP
jgi:hypothetical protein